MKVTRRERFVLFLLCHNQARAGPPIFKNHRGFESDRPKILGARPPERDPEFERAQSSHVKAPWSGRFTRSDRMLPSVRPRVGADDPATWRTTRGPKDWPCQLSEQVPPCHSRSSALHNQDPVQTSARQANAKRRELAA
jgi:hypothetical protein